MRQTFLVGIFSLWVSLVLLASVFVFAGGVSLELTALMAGLAVLPVITALIATGWGRRWPHGRRALFVSLPWILMSAFFVSVSGGLSSPALVFAAFPPLFALAFGWTGLAVETAIFSLIAAVGAIAAAALIGPAAAFADLARASELYAFAGICVLPFLVAGLVSPQIGTVRPRHDPQEDEALPVIGPAAGLDPIEPEENDITPAEDRGDLIVDVTREGRIRSASGTVPEGLSFRAGRVFLDAFPEEDRARLRRRCAAGGSFVETLANGERLSFTIDRHDLGMRVFIGEAEAPAQVEAAASASAEPAAEAAPEAEARVMQAEQALAERTAFFAGLGHDLKTPLNAILGFSDLMRSELRGPLPEAYRDYADLIHDSGQDLLLLVEDMLDYAKAEAGHVRMEIEPVDLIASGDSVLAQLSGQAERAGVTVRMLATGEVWAKADPRAIRQIWQNLLSNAIKYSERGGTVTLDARAGRTAVALSVRDTGAGMDADDLERVAKPFQQGRNAKGKAGTGLGLAVVHRFAEEMGGKVAIDTAPGEGTRVRVILPKAASGDVPQFEDAAE